MNTYGQVPSSNYAQSRIDTPEHPGRTGSPRAALGRPPLGAEPRQVADDYQGSGDSRLSHDLSRTPSGDSRRDGDPDHHATESLRDIDRRERRAARVEKRHGRHDAQRESRRHVQRRHIEPDDSRQLHVEYQRQRGGRVALRQWQLRRDDARRQRWQLHVDLDRPHQRRRNMGAHPRRHEVGNRASGLALAAVLLLTPAVVVRFGTHTFNGSLAPYIHLLVAALAAGWLLAMILVCRQVMGQRRGHVARGASGWVAAMVLTAVSWWLPATSVGAATSASAHLASDHPSLVIDLTAPLIPLALVAKRRRDDIARLDPAPLSDVEDLQFFDERVAELIYAALPSFGSGTCELQWPAPRLAPRVDDPVVVSHHRSSSWAAVSFARPGGTLEMDDGASVYSDATLLHDGGRLVIAHDRDSAIRALALRLSERDVVLLDGDDHGLDDELRRRLITVSRPSHPRAMARVVLLRAEPLVQSIGPVPSDMRRRVTELAAYLALHRRDAVTGERLRSRVIGNDEREGSPRVLANLASTLRRALGDDGDGPRLHSVTHDGLYRSHGLISDVEEFLQLVDEARRHDEVAVVRLTRALDMVAGEPLSACLTSYQWFLAEGHAARVARAGEWAGLALASRCVADGDVERAYWALDQARLLDPYSDDLIAAQARIPRLREFGGDGPRRTQHQTIGSGSAVSGSGALNGFA